MRQVGSGSQVHTLAWLSCHALAKCFTKKIYFSCNVTYSKFILIGSPILAKDKFFKVMEMELQRPLLVTYWLKETAHHRVTKPLQTVYFKLAGEMHLITI